MDVNAFKQVFAWHSSKVTFVCAILSFPSVILAAPEIQSTDFDQSKNVLTISGSGFGNPDFNFAFLDTLSNSILSKDAKISSYSYESLWDQYGTEWAVPLVPREMAGPFPENKNILYYGGPGRSNNSYLKPIEAQNTRSLYVSWNYRPSLDPNEFGGSNKFIRVWDDHSGTHTRISWTQMHFEYGAADISGSDNISWGGWSGKVNEWNLLELYIDSDKKIIKAWTNGKLIHDINDFMKSTISDGLGIRLLGFDPSVGDPYSDMEVYIDNVYVSNTLARVILSTKPTWDSSLLNTSATQLPIAWSENVIKINVDVNNLTEEAYIYIFDENRSVNQVGYPLSGCPQCPSPPNLLIE